MIHVEGAQGFWGCDFCRGRGCLACAKQSERKYKEAFPEGPKPILTIPIYNTSGDDTGQMAMVDDGCPNAEDAYVVHPDDARKLREVVDQYTRPRTLEELGADLIAALRKQSTTEGRQ